MNRKIRDITGQKFGNWLVKKFTKIHETYKAMWECECQNCSTIKEIALVHLVYKKIKKCNCEKYEDIIGKSFKTWIVLGKIKGYSSKYECSCKECKNKNIFRRSDILSNKCGGCPCQLESLINKTFGKLKVIEESKSKKSQICKCVCYNKIRVSRCKLLSGSKKSCGKKECKPNDPKYKIIHHGYVLLYEPKHPNATKPSKDRRYTPRVLEHKFVMSNYLNRPLDKNEYVHHRNGIRSDNRLENLELWTTVHPAGSRIIDLINYAYHILKKYDDTFDKSKIPQDLKISSIINPQKKVINKYKKIHSPKHSKNRTTNQIEEHIAIMSEFLGRPLEKGEFIHHKNGIRDDNRIENLELWNRNHPIGARKEDLIKYSYYILEKYKDYKDT